MRSPLLRHVSSTMTQFEVLLIHSQREGTKSLPRKNTYPGTAKRDLQEEEQSYFLQAIYLRSVANTSFSERNYTHFTSLADRSFPVRLSTSVVKMSNDGETPPEDIAKTLSAALLRKVAFKQPSLQHETSKVSRLGHSAWIQAWPGPSVSGEGFGSRPFLLQALVQSPFQQPEGSELPVQSIEGQCKLSGQRVACGPLDRARYRRVRRARHAGFSASRPGVSSSLASLL